MKQRIRNIAEWFLLFVQVVTAIRTLRNIVKESKRLKEAREHRKEINEKYDNFCRVQTILNKSRDWDKWSNEEKEIYNNYWGKTEDQ